VWPSGTTGKIEVAALLLQTKQYLQYSHSVSLAAVFTQQNSLLYTFLFPSVTRISIDCEKQKYIAHGSRIGGHSVVWMLLQADESLRSLSTSSSELVISLQSLLIIKSMDR
jgi:hypothetical protein